MTDQEKKPETPPNFPTPSKYEPVYLDPRDRSVPGEYNVLRKENRRRVFGAASKIAPGTDFDLFGPK